MKVVRLRRGDVVGPRLSDGAVFYGRVWRRYDQDHVLVICTGKHVRLYHDTELVKLNYKGTWEWQRHPGNENGNKPLWIPMTSLRKLKARARDYQPFFGGLRYCGYAWTRKDKREAWDNIQERRFKPREHATDRLPKYIEQGLVQS